nr:ImmA/IrrE family metallo-endopeptidase [Microbacterium hydrocarbonoxydans]
MSNIFEGQTVAEIRRRARNDADATATVYWQDGRVPVDPVRIARDMGIQVFSAQLGDDVYGMINGTDSGVEIYVDQDNPEVRQRFTIAHEIGHFVANASSLDGEVNFVERRSDSGAGTSDEIHANEFAASLLMPEQQVRVAHEGSRDVFRLAQMFDVSVPAMRWRLRHLELPAS